MANRIQLELRRSIAEEREASRRYRARAVYADSISDTQTAKLYRHIAHEEDGHASEFGTMLGRRK